MASLLTIFSSRDTSVRSCSISDAGTEGAEDETTETEGTATSIILSAISASLSRMVESEVEAKTILMFDCSRCRKSSLKNDPSVTPGQSPRSCCIVRRSCVSLLPPWSAVVNNCWSLRCSEAAVLRASCALRVAYGWSAGGFNRRSVTSVVPGKTPLDQTWSAVK